MTLTAAEKQDLAEKALALDELLGSKGWALMDYAFQQYEQAAFSKMMNGATSDVVRHAANYTAIREFRTWAKRQRDFLAEQLK